MALANGAPEPMDPIDAMIDALERLRVAEHLISHRLEYPQQRPEGYLDSDLAIASEIIEGVVAELRASVDRATAPTQEVQ